MSPRLPIRLLLGIVIAVVMVMASGWLDQLLDPRVTRGEAGLSSGEGDAQLRAAYESEHPSGISIASVGGTFTDASGQERALESLVGKPFVLSLVYTRCATVCPRTMAELQRLERDAARVAPARFVVVSLDPAHDVPDTLKAFGAKYGLDREHWTLLTPEPVALATLASALGVSFGPDAAGGVMHSAVIAMVDSAGAVRTRHVGLGTSPERLLADWRAVRLVPPGLAD